MIKTCQVTSVHQRYDARVFRKVAVSLARNGFDSYLLIADTLPDEDKDDVKIRSTHKVCKNRISRIFSSWKMLRKPALEIDADIYQLHDPELFKLAKFLKKHGKRVIFDSHEDYSSSVADKPWIPKPFRGLIQKSFNKKQKKILSKVDGLITVTYFIQDKLLKINPNTIVIANFPDLFPKKEHKFDNLDICFGGNSSYYSHRELIDVLPSFNGEVKFNLVSEPSQDELNNWKSSPGWMYVNYRGLMPFKELQKIYEQSALGFVVIKYTKNYGYKEGSIGVIKLFEFMMEGMPVICTDFNVFKQIVGENKCGICVNPDSREEIYNAIKFFKDNPKLLKEYGENGRRLAEEKYNWKTQEVELVNFYNRLMERK